MKRWLYVFVALLFVAIPIYANGEDEVSCYAEDDAFIMWSSPDTSFGDYPWLMTGADTYEVDRALFKYDLSPIPDDVSIISVIWNFCVEELDGNQGFYWQGYLLQNYWDEEEVTWNNCPNFGDEIMFEHWTPQYLGWDEVEFNDYGINILQTWVDGTPNTGFIWKRNDTDHTLGIITVTSKEGEYEQNQTYLSVTYVQSWVQTTSIGKVRVLFR